MNHVRALSILAVSSVTASATAQAVTWEFLARQSTDVDVAGVPTAVWVPGAFNNGCIDNEGRVIVANTIQNADTTLTNANNRVLMRGVLRHGLRRRTSRHLGVPRQAVDGRQCRRRADCGLGSRRVQQRLHR